MRVIMKSEATDRQMGIGRRVYPDAEIIRKDEVYVVVRRTPIGDRLHGVFDSLEQIEQTVGKIRPPKSYETIGLEDEGDCCGIVNGLFIFKFRLNEYRG